MKKCCLYKKAILSRMNTHIYHESKMLILIILLQNDKASIDLFFI